MQYIATLLNIEPNCNPEYSFVPIEAEDEKEAEKKAKVILKGELHHVNLGWTSYRDTELWGKEQRVFVDVVTDEDHVKRSGRGNIRSTETQEERFARFRAAAKA